MFENGSMQIKLFLITCISTCFFCCLGYTPAMDKIISMLLILYLCYRACMPSSLEYDDTSNFKKEVLAMAFVPFLSVFSCYFYHGQDMATTAIATRANLIWLFYIVLHKDGYLSDSVKQNLIMAAFIASGLYIIQQALYPSFYYFDENAEITDIEVRNGLYRFRLFRNAYFIYWGLYYYIDIFLKDKGKLNFLWVVVMLVGIYLTLTRQIWFSILLPIFLIPFVKDNEISLKKTFAIVVSVVAAYFLISNLSAIIGSEMIESTKNQLDNEDDIRLVGMTYFGLEYWVDWLNVVFGNGVPSFGNSEYGNFMQSLRDNNHLFVSDIGIVGSFSTYGLVYILAYIFLYVKIFKNFRYLSLYNKLLVIASIINLPLATWNYPVFMSMMLFLMDYDINENKQILLEE